MDINIETRLKEKVKPILKKGRPGDYEHTMRVLEMGRSILKHEKGEEKIAIPAIYLHDIGYSKVNFEDFVNDMPDLSKPAPTPRSFSSQIPKSLVLHMKYGAEMAKEILEELDFKDEEIKRITKIISVHDNPSEIFSMEDDSALVLYEADHLDRLHPEGSNRLKQFRKHESADFINKQLKKRFSEAGPKKWFKTKTAKKMAEKMLEAL